MIDPKELRIGNLIYYPYQRSAPDEWVYGEAVICGIHENGVQFKKKNGGSSLVQSLDDLAPIPITPEWLERLGFACDGNYCDIRIMGGYLRISDDIDECLLFTGSEYSLTVSMDYSTCEIHNAPKYVHQLQNLYFALTGQELTIK